MKPKILLIGGSGFIGSRIVASLVDTGFEVSVLSRSRRPPRGIWIQGNRNNLSQLEAVTKTHWEMVIDNISYTAEEMRHSLEAIPRAKHWILTSTVSVYRYSPQRQTPFKEEMVRHDFRPPEENLADKHWKYARGKLETENELIRSGVAHTILRPTMVFGAEDVTARTDWYVGKLGRGETIRIPQSDSRFKLVSVEDVGRAFALVASLRPSGAFNVVQKEAFTLEEFITSLAKAMGLKPKLEVDSGATEETAGPYLLSGDWSVSGDKLEALGFTPTPWPIVASKLGRSNAARG